jgi:hypothetical protein
MMSTAKIIMFGSLAAVASMLLYFRGDLRRYAKMKRM